MALSQIKKKYFNQGICEHLSKDYFMVGLIIRRGPCVAKVLFYCKLIITIMLLLCSFMTS